MIGSSAGPALPSLAAEARPSTITGHPLVGLMDIDVHLLGRTGPSHHRPLLRFLEKRPWGGVPSRYDAGVTDDATVVDFGIAAVLLPFVANTEV